MKILRQSTYSGKVHQRDLNVTKHQLLQWQVGMHAQKVFPFLSPGDREFLISGTTNEEWDKMAADWFIAVEADTDDSGQILLLNPMEVNEILEFIKRY